ncbi:MAG: glycyl-radical enzyme activating protein [Spirochaetaceae bacterium]|jgi:pyruvate formate lyase activating enzyme|nr:glycyl-radical enzyme activating protein [Spirochaetaceae bacterium]
MKQNPAGFLSNIQKFSLHDGPGIRTVVFFKGCPLSCRWCSNPETRQTTVSVLRDTAKCVHCLRCAEVCPAGAIKEGLSINHAACTACGTCVRECPQKALSLNGRRYSPEETLRICLQDRPFYEESGGGVTLSGGEVLTQAAFARALLEALKREGIHTALETTGYARPGVFRHLTEAADLLLFDIKHYDRDRHFWGTGVYNDLILGNLRAALAAQKEVLPRLPIIPGFNGAPEDALGFSRLLESLGLKRAQLLPFHQFGEKKYEMLGLPYPMRGVPQLHREDLEEYRRIFTNCGIDTWF